MSTRSRDAAELPQASVDFDYDEIDRRLGPQQIVEDEAKEKLLEFLRENPEYVEEALGHIKSKVTDAVKDTLIKFICIVIESRNYLLMIDIAILATGIPLYQGCSYEEIATKHGITKQALSKRVIAFQKRFNLPPTRAQKSLKARESYSISATRVHQKRKEKKEERYG
jgi:hypothetical protein